MNNWKQSNEFSIYPNGKIYYEFFNIGKIDCGYIFYSPYHELDTNKRLKMIFKIIYGL